MTGKARVVQGEWGTYSVEVDWDDSVQNFGGPYATPEHARAGVDAYWAGRAPLSKVPIVIRWE